MARSYANIFCAIWDDPDFCALSSDAQRTYFMLVTQPDITACGTLPLTLRRWSRTLPPSDQASLGFGLQELAARRFIITDEDTEELLVRTFAKHDGGYKHAVRVKAVVSSAQAVRSHSLRTAVAHELTRLGVSIATGQAPGTESIATEVAPESHPTGTPEAVESRGSVVTELETDRTPHSGNRAPAPATEPSDTHAAQEQQLKRLRAELSRTGNATSWANLADDFRTEVLHHIATHGVATMTAAITARRDPPPRHAAAWRDLWNNLAPAATQSTPDQAFAELEARHAPQPEGGTP